MLMDLKQYWLNKNSDMHSDAMFMSSWSYSNYQFSSFLNSAHVNIQAPNIKGNFYFSKGSTST